MGKLQGLPQIGEREIEDDFFFTHGHLQKQTACGEAGEK